MQKVDPYEYIGVIVPGVVLVVACLLIYPDLEDLLKDNLSIGEFGLILILALVTGHLLQTVGNLFESIFWWAQGGVPSTWPCKEKTSLLSSGQKERLRDAVKADFDAELSGLKDGRGLTRELYAKIRSKGRTDRIEAFNRNYGLMRGVASAFLVTGLLIALKDYGQWQLFILVFVAFAAAAYRMKRFGEHYARELFAEYLQCRE